MTLIYTVTRIKFIKMLIESQTRVREYSSEHASGPEGPSLQKLGWRHAQPPVSGSEVGGGPGQSLLLPASRRLRAEAAHPALCGPHCWPVVLLSIHTRQPACGPSPLQPSAVPQWARLCGS